MFLRHVALISCCIYWVVSKVGRGSNTLYDDYAVISDTVRKYPRRRFNWLVSKRGSVAANTLCDDHSELLTLSEKYNRPIFGHKIVTNDRL